MTTGVAWEVAVAAVDTNKCSSKRLQHINSNSSRSLAARRMNKR